MPGQRSRRTASRVLTKAPREMNVRTCARVLIAVLFSISGLVETLSATGLVVELSPDGGWGPGVHTLSVSGPLQMVGAALLASGRMARWILSILGCYVFLVGVFGNLPLILNPDVGGSAIAGLLSNLATMGGIFYWLRSAGMPAAHRARPALPMTTASPVCRSDRWFAEIRQAHRRLRQVK